MAVVAASVHVKASASAFEHLLAEFSRCTSSHPKSELCLRFDALLATFGDAVSKQRKELASQAIANADSFRELLSDFERQLDIIEGRKEETADGFNSLEVFGLTYWELTHSKALAWLLDRNPRPRGFGTHFQRGLGLRLFLEAVGMDPSLADERYQVCTEVAGTHSRIDVEVSCAGKFLIAIENKIWAAEGCDQTNREWRDIEGRAKDLGLDPQSGAVRAFFLTPFGDIPSCPHFTMLKWRKIVDVLTRFSEEARAPMVKQFAKHYADILRDQIASFDLE